MCQHHMSDSQASQPATAGVGTSATARLPARDVRQVGGARPAGIERFKRTGSGLATSAGVRIGCATAACQPALREVSLGRQARNVPAVWRRFPMPESAPGLIGETVDGPRQLGRRRFLTFLVAAPALTVAARVGAEVLAPARADAVVPSPPQPADVADFGDVMTALTRADTDLFVLQVTTDNRIRFEVPRAEVGQGITTALAMIVAEELDARLADVDVPLSDARQDLGTAQSTGGSTSVRSLWDPVRQLAAAARARLVTAAAQEWNVPADHADAPTTRRCGRPTGARPPTGR